MARAAAATRGLGAAGKSSSRSIGLMGRTLEKLRSPMGGMVAAFAALATIGTFKRLVVGFDTAFVGVTKTVDGTTKQLAELRSGLLDMSKILPTSAEDIAAVAESAGQLGIQRGNILSFTKTMVDLGEATNLTADQAATALARFANITQLPQDQFERLGSVIVGLGNTMATTEAEITTMSTRLAAAGTLAGFTQANILALSGSLSSVGVQAEAGGSAMSRVITNINSAVLSASSDLQVFADIAGVTADEFASEWRAGPAETLSMVVDGLGRINASGGDAAATLNEVGLGGIRTSRSLLSLATSNGILTTALSSANKLWDENNALSIEAEKRYRSAGARLGILSNNLKAFVIEQGQKVLPSMVTAIDKVIAAFGSLDQIASFIDQNFAPAFISIIDLVGSIADIAIQVGSAIAPLLVLLSAGGLILAAQALDAVATALASVLGWAKDSTPVIATLTILLGVQMAEAAIGAATALTSMAALSIMRGLDGIGARLLYAKESLRGFVKLARNNPFGALAKAAPMIAIAGVVVGLLAAKGAFDQAKRSAQEMATAITKDVDTSSIMSVRESLAALNTEYDRARMKLGKKGFGARWIDSMAEMGNAMLGWVGGSSDMQDSALDLNAELGALGKEHRRLRDEFAKQVGLRFETFDQAAFLASVDFTGLGEVVNAQFQRGIAASGAIPSLLGSFVSSADLARPLGDLPANVRAAIEPFADLQNQTNSLQNALMNLAVAQKIDLTGMNAEQAAAALLELYQRTKNQTSAQIDLGKAITTSGDEFATLQQRVKAYSKALDNLFNPARSMFDKQTKLAGVFADLAKAVSEGTTSIDISTEAGRENRDMLSDVVGTILDMVNATVDQTGSIDAANAVLLTQRERLIGAMQAWGMTRDAAEGLVAQLGLIPANVDVALQMRGNDLTQQQIDDLVSSLGGLSDTPTIVDIIGDPTAFNSVTADVLATLDQLSIISGGPKLTLDSSSFDAVNRAAIAAIETIDGKVATGVIKADDFASSVVTEAIRNLMIINGMTVTARVRVDAPSGFGMQGSGAGRAVFDFSRRAQGGLDAPHTAQIAAGGAMRLWAEPETGGESYIPLAQSKRTRSMAILQQTAQMFGAAVIPMASGGITNAAVQAVADAYGLMVVGPGLGLREDTRQLIRSQAIDARSGLGPGAVFTPGEEARFRPGAYLIPISSSGGYVSPFTDVQAGKFYSDAVAAAAAAGITIGTTATTFSPGQTMTRAEAVTMLWRQEGSPGGNPATSFLDVPLDTFFTEAVKWATAAGITTGTTATTFDPYAKVTRAQLATMIWRKAGSPAGAAPSGFLDVANQTWATPAIDWAASQGVTTGTSATTFDPNRGTTRAEGVTMIIRAGPTPTALPGPSASTAPPTPSVPVAAPPPGGMQTYTVNPGDSLSSIAAKFGTTWQAIQDLNNYLSGGTALPNANMIRPGQHLFIPPINMAEGGIVTSPRSVLFGESGPEAFIPLSASKRVQGEETLRRAASIMGMDMVPVARGAPLHASTAPPGIDTAAIAQAVTIGVRDALRSESSDTVIEISGREVARQVQTHLRDFVRAGQ